jgi:lipid-binding SYLF domain-containing protein
VKLGADASVAGGPKGRTASAETDIVMKAEILSYSRSRGVFAGLSLEGSTLRSDGGANKKLYGKELSAARSFGRAR